MTLHEDLLKQTRTQTVWSGFDSSDPTHGRRATATIRRSEYRPGFTVSFLAAIVGWARH